MSEDMSMFRKMKDKITDEVNSATNRLQSMQIIDQLASSIGQQVLKNDLMPHQTLPELSEQIALSSNSHFGLKNDNRVENSDEDEELNSEVSPQHQLFNESSIRRLKSPNSNKSTSASHRNGSNSDPNGSTSQGNQQSVIDINVLSSDIEDEVGDVVADDDGEIDLLSERKQPLTRDANDDILTTYKTRYRNVVHAIRRLNDDHRLDKFQLESEAKRLIDQITSMEVELNNVKQQLTNTNNLAIDHESERKNSSSPHQSSKQSSKLKDLEKLMAKCKESLKAKNAQLKILKSTLVDVDKFRDQMDELRNELKELKNAHETWTLSIAESKRVMHQEIETKNNEMESIKSQLKDSSNRLLQQKSNIQNLESRLVSMSAAHQKERESLIKDLTNAKNSAMKRLQREHELQLERVKLDLEKSIEALKSDVLSRDEQIIRTGQRNRELEESNAKLEIDLEDYKKRCQDHGKELEILRNDRGSHLEEIKELKIQLDEHEFDQLDQLDQNADLIKKVEDLSREVTELRGTNEDLTRQLETAKSDSSQNKDPQPCSECLEHKDKLRKEAESHEQALFEIHTKLDLMTTANADQEKAINELRVERDSALATVKSLRSDIDDLSKKNESLLQVIQDNDSEMQSQQEQLNQLSSLKQLLDDSKKEISTINSSLDRAKAELSERNGELTQAQETIDELKSRLTEIERSFKDVSVEFENLKKDKESLLANLDTESKKRREVDQNLVVNILAALKNLETPETSPGSDKTYQYDPTESGNDESVQGLPDPVKLAENLSSLALDRSNAYMTSTQRLQAVILDNTMISEEIKRLREELNALSREKSQEIMSSLEEVERLRTENQALVHDQKSYEDQIALLEADVASLQRKMHEKDSDKNELAIESANSKEDIAILTDELDKKNAEIEQLKRLVDETNREMESKIEAVLDPGAPSSTEYEYLKNIVYQFMMGREPVTLARVISAIFKFDKDQMDQICKVQEAIHQV